ncbi:FAD-binding oxidoreductase [Lentibacter algarum]|uniref:NAD(P)/FAD-dependent oxidoreductase n=1 Tax=Lentibacter algarum TaxID=576131 RepID=UPI001C06B5E9|nr:FAD-binding oxidoreductase [Lentibacter algarum]MBU2980534.1 FAD-binding oxidoreductase [Lentibacter algarum]
MVDVTVRGAGVFGLSIAWECLSRGAKVRVIDPNGVAAGASGGIVGALAPHVPENWNEKKERQFESLIAAEDFWKNVQFWAGIETSYARTGRIQPLADERAVALARGREETSKLLWKGKAQWRVCHADDLLGLVPDSATGQYVHDTLTARIFPKQACEALAKAIEARGGVITTEAEDAGKVVWATGVHDLERMNRHFAGNIGSAVKGQGALLKYDASNAPQVFADTVHIVPHWNGTVAVGSTSEREFETPFDTDEQLDAVLERAYAVLPVLRDAEVIQRWAGLRPKAKSRAPMLGAHPLFEGQFIANGGFKIGFGMATEIARMMAEMILDETDSIPAEFGPDASL